MEYKREHVKLSPCLRPIFRAPGPTFNSAQLSRLGYHKAGLRPRNAWVNSCAGHTREPLNTEFIAKTIRNETNNTV